MPNIRDLPLVDMDLRDLIVALENGRVLVWGDPPGQSRLVKRPRLSGAALRRLRSAAEGNATMAEAGVRLVAVLG